MESKKTCKCVCKCVSAALEEKAKAMPKKKILLRATHVLKTGDYDSTTPYYSEFDILDLNTDKLIKTPFTLLHDSAVGAFLFSESQSEPIIYIFCKRPDGSAFRRMPLDYSLYYASVESQDDVVAEHDPGLSFFTLPKPELGWRNGPAPEPLPVDDKYQPNCVEFRGKLYLFKRSGSNTCDGFGYVYDPEVNEWSTMRSPPPPLPGKYKVSTPLVADTVNNRILVHFEDHTLLPVSCPRPLYAYYLADGHWECLVDHFEEAWEGPLAFVDGVVYFFIRKIRELLWAYDLHAKEWLEVVLTTQFDEDYSRYNFQGLHHLGGGFMCLMTYTYRLCNMDPSITKNHTVLRAVQFKLERLAGQVLVTPLPSLSCPMESCCRIQGQLASEYF